MYNNQFFFPVGETEITYNIRKLCYLKLSVWLAYSKGHEISEIVAFILRITDHKYGAAD
jgi:hypothetical protein